MDFLSAKTLEGKLWVTFQIVKYGVERGVWEMKAEKETLAQRDKGREI